MKIINTTRQTVIAQRASTADTFASRAVGLLNRASLDPGEALIIKPCNAIHMFFMRFAIDAIFVDKNNRVAGLLKAIKPFHLSPIFLKSSFVIEASVGTIEASKTCVGDVLEVN